MKSLVGVMRSLQSVLCLAFCASGSPLKRLVAVLMSPTDIYIYIYTCIYTYICMYILCLIYKDDPGVGALLVAWFPPCPGRWEPKDFRSGVSPQKPVGVIPRTRAHKGPGCPQGSGPGDRGQAPRGPWPRAQAAACGPGGT